MKKTIVFIAGVLITLGSIWTNNRYAAEPITWERKRGFNVQDAFVDSIYVVTVNRDTVWYYREPLSASAIEKLQ